jgi:hypothetical protein
VFFYTVFGCFSSRQPCGGGASYTQGQDWNKLTQLPVEIDLGREYFFHSVFACPVVGRGALVAHVVFSCLQLSSSVVFS